MASNGFQYVSLLPNPHSQVEMREMGTTELPKEVFLEFLEELRPRFTAMTYDLITNNCNNFSNEVTNFLLGQSIPASITEVAPRSRARVVSTGPINSVSSSWQILTKCCPGVTRCMDPLY